MNYTFIVETHTLEEAKLFLLWLNKTNVMHNNSTNTLNKAVAKKAEYYVFKGSSTTYLGWSFDYTNETIIDNYYKKYYCEDPVRITLKDFLKIVQYKNNRKDIHRALCKLEETCKMTNGTTTVNPWL